MLGSRPVSAVHEPPGGLDPEQPYLELRVPADPEYVRAVRLAAGDMGGRVGLSVDELDDVRLAVDEVCSMLIGAGGAGITVRMQARHRLLIIDARSPGTRSATVPTELSEILIRALVDTCTFTDRDREARFELRKTARELG